MILSKHFVTSRNLSQVWAYGIRNEEFYHKGTKTPRSFLNPLCLGVLVVEILDEFGAIGLLCMNSSDMEAEAMSTQFCPECGHENPGEARFCMDCGRPLTGEVALTRAAEPTPISRPHDHGLDWAGIVAAILAFLSLKHLSRKARQTILIITFLMLFFGCPMICGFATYVIDSILKLFQ